MPRCIQCGAEVTSDEIGLTLKLINRGCTEYYCIRCLASRFKVSEDDLRDLVVTLREQGCTLFL